MNQYDIIIIGIGLSGSVIASQLVKLNKKILMIDQRNHIGGNCYDYINELGFLECKYGAHIFHTNNERVWNFIQKYSKWIPYEHKVKANVNEKLISIPVNIMTINELYNTNIKNKNEMNDWLEKKRKKISIIKNGEDTIVSKCGQELYEILFKDYTKKQWNKYPDELDASVLERIPIRNDFNDLYFNDKYQVMPEKGYTEFIKNMIKNEKIDIMLNKNYNELNYEKTKNQIIIYTGPIDLYFEKFNLSKLQYRSLIFEREILNDIDYYQTLGVINYPLPNEKFTRIVEPKHFYNNQDKKGTVIIKEYSTDEGEPYYPIINEENINLYKKYQELAKKEEKNNVYFIGRLANYKYFNMDQAILNALEFSDIMLKKLF
jgi:UDP-galactopyranose mutase